MLFVVSTAAGGRYLILVCRFTVRWPKLKVVKNRQSIFFCFFFYMFCKQNECKPFEYKDPSKIRVLYLRQKRFLGVVYGTNVTIHVRNCNGKM